MENYSVGENKIEQPLHISANKILGTHHATAEQLLPTCLCSGWREHRAIWAVGSAPSPASIACEALWSYDQLQGCTLSSSVPTANGLQTPAVGWCTAMTGPATFSKELGTKSQEHPAAQEAP